MSEEASFFFSKSDCGLVVVVLYMLKDFSPFFASDCFVFFSRDG